jgi:hypothetical protein
MREQQIRVATVMGAAIVAVVQLAAIGPADLPLTIALLAFAVSIPAGGLYVSHMYSNVDFIYTRFQWIGFFSKLL